MDQAETALNDTNQTSWNGRTINVEYVSREADGRCAFIPFSREAEATSACATCSDKGRQS